MNSSQTFTPGAAHGSEPFRYSRALVSLHWLMFLLFIAVYATIELRVLFPKGTDTRELMKALHFMLGLSVMLMAVLRLGARWFSAKPVIHAKTTTQAWTHRIASAGHMALYALMVGMPLLGWLYLSAAGKPIPFFGLELPALMNPDKALSKDIKELHEAIGVAGYWLIGVHVTAALGHHYLLKDRLLERMSLNRVAMVN